jgi:lipopolysaccharide export system protein LptA
MIRFPRITAVMVALSLLAAAPLLKAQRRNSNDDRDPHVTLISAKSAELIEKNGQSFRKVTGPARFYHNHTYLVCDTAWWNVNTNVIRCIGHVKITQDRTTLTSETLEYVVDEDMARFRGLVQLEDKDHDILRTRYLDYNTKDSVAVFQGGASMKDKDGQIIESLYGTYESKLSLFVFNDEVNMFSDSIFVKTSRLEYRSDINTAYFGYGTDAWESDRMLSANDGWYDRNREIFFFRKKVHVLTKDQEAWSDSLFYHRNTNDLEMLGNVELIDTTRNVYSLAGKLEYRDSSSLVKLTRDPAVVSISEKDSQKDTIYFGADTLIYMGIPRCDVDSIAVVNANKRLEDLTGDPVTEYRKKAAEEARKAAEEAMADDPNRPPTGRGAVAPGAGRGTVPPGTSSVSTGTSTAPPVNPSGPPSVIPSEAEGSPDSEPAAPSDTLRAPADSLLAPMDSLSTSAPDSLATEEPLVTEPVVETPPAPKDTTKVGFILAKRNVRMFREDIQLACDSLVFTELDSLVRLYKDPIVFNEGNRQYVADSIYVVVHGQAVEKAWLMSDAFITTCEDSLAHAFDQIRGAEMVAYFDSTAALRRFDALGGASALFFLEENGSLATVNKVESKMLYATFANGDLQRIYYFEDAKNDAYPVVQLPKEERELKGFRWDPDKRPKGPEDITSLVPRGSERTSYLARAHPEYKQTNKYFPGYINNIYKEIARRDALAVERARAKAAAEAAAEEASGEETSPEEEDTGSGDEVVAGDDTAPEEPSNDGSGDGVGDDSGSGEPQPELSEKERKRLERERRRAERQAAREARWAEQDRKYEERQAAKEQKRLERERARKLRALKRAERRARRERRIYERYLERELRRQARNQK